MTHNFILRCPSCDSENGDIVEVLTVINRRLTPQHIDPASGGLCDAEIGTEECLDTERDSAEFRCDECGFQTSDPDEFAHDLEAEEQEAHDLATNDCQIWGNLPHSMQERYRALAREEII